MEIIDTICRHPLYKEHYEKLQELEKGRVFCHHDMAHFLDVARIAHIHNLERDLKIRKEVIYAAALLHDIGKDRQYTEKIPHERASAEIAGRILNDVAMSTTSVENAERILDDAATNAERILDDVATNAERILDDVATGTPSMEIAGTEKGRRREAFSKEERDEILKAILGHRKRRDGMGVLEELLYVSDKQSRICFVCAAEEEYDWGGEKKNNRIRL